MDRWIKLTRGLLIRERVRKRFSYHHGCYEGEEVEGREEEGKRTD